MGVGALTHEYEMGALRRRYVTKTLTCASECINQKSAGLFDGFVDCRHSWGRGEEKTISPPPQSVVGTGGRGKRLCSVFAIYAQSVSFRGKYAKEKNE